MEDLTNIKMELQIPGQRLISALAIHSEKIAKEITEGVEKAVAAFDFEKEVELQTGKMIREIIAKTMWGNSVKTLVEKKVNDIVQELVEREMKAWESKTNSK